MTGFTPHISNLCDKDNSNACSVNSTKFVNNGNIFIIFKTPKSFILFVNNLINNK